MQAASSARARCSNSRVRIHEPPGRPKANTAALLRGGYPVSDVEYAANESAPAKVLSPASKTQAAGRRWLVDLLLLAALWGASFLFMRIGAAEFGALPTAAVRVAIATVFLLPLLVMRGQWSSFRQYWKPALGVGVLNSGMPFAFFAFALLTINSGLAAVLNATVPMFGALVAWAWFGDR